MNLLNALSNILTQETTSLFYLEAAKILTYGTLSFIIAMWWGPLLIDTLVWMKFWKKKSRTASMTGESLEITKQFYENDEAKVKVPRAGGLLIWVTALGFALVLWLVLRINSNPTTQFLNFIDRRQTFIPLGTLFFAGVVGFIDDALSTLESGGNYFAGGLKLSHRFGFVTLLGLIIGWWFYSRLEISSFSLGFMDVTFNNLSNGIFFSVSEYATTEFWSFLNVFIPVTAGWLIVPIVAIVMLLLWGTSMIDGFDGLAAGVFIPIYLCFAALSFSRGFYDISTFLMVIAGSLAAYLWYNIPPAKFYMGDTGTMALLLTLGVVAFLIDAVYVLPIAGFILFVTEGSVIIQVFSKKFFKRKVFLAAPLHHHLEASGWLRHQVTMRFWLISIMTSVLGLAIGLMLG